MLQQKKQKETKRPQKLIWQEHKYHYIFNDSKSSRDSMNVVQLKYYTHESINGLVPCHALLKLGTPVLISVDQISGVILS